MEKFPKESVVETSEIGEDIVEKERLEIIKEGKEKIIALAMELSEEKELPYPGINPDRYQELKADEEDYLGFATPIDDLIKRLQGEGIKVVLGDDPTSGNVFVLPAGSNDIENDSLLPRHLEVNDLMDPRFKELISIQKGFKKK